MIALRILREPVAVLSIFAAGLAATALGPLLADTPDHARAVWSVWPVLVLGGIAVARMIRRGPGMEGTGWLGWWTAGFLAYLVHLRFGFGVIYAYDLQAVRTGQGLVTTVANFTLLALWGLSLLATILPREPPGEQALHVLASGLFAVTALASTVLFAAHPVSVAIGAGLALIWLHALWRRLV